MARLPKFLPTLILLCATAFAQPTARNRITQAIDSGNMTPLPGSRHPLALPEFDQGRLLAPLRLSDVSIYFALSASQKADLKSLQAQLHDPASANYRKWLTPGQFADRFGMSQQDIDKVSVWLVSQGFKVDGVSRSRNRISFSGTTAQIENVFRTEFHQYLVEGKTHFAPDSELQIPVALSGAVLGFGSLDDFRPKPKNLLRPRFTSTTSGNTFLAPADVATIYNINPLYTAGIDGKGQSLVVVGQTAISLADINAFRAASGLPSNPPQLLLMPNSGTSFTSTDPNELAEAHLDVEWSGAVAKNAAVIYVYTGSAANKNVINAFEYAIDNNLAPVISISYGNCESIINSSNPNNVSILQADAQQADVQGQTISAASGDDGAADCESSNATVATHGLAVDIPGAIAEVTSVGGTTFTGDDNHNPTYWLAVNDPATGGSAIQYIPETTWNDAIARGDLSSGGGGVSSLIPKPSWQNGKTPADGKRDVPDISLSASPEHDPYLICSQGSCVNGFRAANGDLSAVGGTSVGAPVFAGMVTLLNQATQNSSGQGTVNPTLYSLSGTSAFHDITTGDNKVPCQSGTTNCPASAPFVIGFSAGAGYDLATGLGTINTNNLAHAWPGFTATPSYSLTASAASVTSPGQSGTATVTVNSTTGFTGTINLTCTPLTTTAEMGCSVSPTSVALSGATNTAQATVTVTTTAAHAISGTSARLTGFVGSGAFLACLFVTGVTSRRRRWMALMGLLLIVFVAVGIGCGGGGGGGGGIGNGGGDPGTATGNYVVAVTGKSGSIAHTVNVTVAVH